MRSHLDGVIMQKHKLDTRHHQAASLRGKLGAVSVELTPNDLRSIDDAAAKITVQGARYPEKLEQMTGR